MRRVTIKEFQKNIYTQMKELPVVVTRNGIPYCAILSTDELKKTSTLGLVGKINELKKI